MQMTVLQVISSAGFYGAESMLLNLIEALFGTLFRPVLACVVNDQGPSRQLGGMAAAKGIPVEFIPCKGRVDLRALHRLRECVRGLRANVVHSHGYKADLYSFLATRNLRVPLVATCHNWTDASAAVTLYGRLDRIVLPRFQAVAPVSNEVARRLGNRLKPERVRLIPNGVATGLFDGTLPNLRQSPVVGMVGRLVAEKGFADVLQVAPQVLSVFPLTKFVVFGDGPQRQELEATARAAGMDGCVSFLGHCSDRKKIFQKIDVFVLPSYNEGLPMTLLEALAMRKAVIASRVGGIPSVIRNEDNGLLVTAGDKAALANSICRLLDDAELRTRFGERGRETVVREYSAGAMAHRYAQMYSEAIQSLAGVKAYPFSRGTEPRPLGSGGISSR